MQTGEKVEDFALEDQFGVQRHLSEFLALGRVVLFFYPAAMTKGCTAENCHFHDLAAEFAALSAQRLGISPDAVDKQRSFADRYDLDYPLLSDPDGAIARRFGVRRNIGLKTRRWTFVIDRDGTLIETIKSEFSMAAHADRALQILKSH